MIFRSSRFSDPKNPKALEPLEFDDPEGFARLAWNPVGAPLALGEYRFLFHLGGEEKPARTVSIELLAPRRPA